MRLTCSQKDLANALGMTNQAVDLNNTLPVLNNVLLKAEGQKLYLSATNLEIAIHFWIEASIKNEGEITIPSRLLTSYVNYLNSADQIEMQVGEGCALDVTTPNSKTKFKGIPAAEFPKIPLVEKEGSFQLSKEDFQSIVEQVSFSASLNTTRPILSGVYFLLSKNQLDVVATDSYRLAEKTLKPKAASGDLSFIVPARTIHQLNYILSIMKQEGVVEVTVSKNQILFAVGEVRLTSRLIEGEFPNYKQIIPKSSKTKATFGTDELTMALKRINLFAKENNHKIIFTFGKSGTKITTDTTQYGEGEIQLKNKLIGEPNEIALNSQYLLDVLAHARSDQVVIEVESKINPATVRPTNDEHYTYIIMPLKM